MSPLNSSAWSCSSDMPAGLNAGWIVAKCQASKRTPKITREMTHAGCVDVFIAARSWVAVSSLLKIAYRETSEIFIRLRRVEDLAAHQGMLSVSLTVGFVAQLFGDFVTFRGKVDLLGDFLVIELSFHVLPTPHLGENPDRHRMPRKGIEIDPVGNVFYVAQPIGELSRENLFQNDLRLIEVVARRDCLGYFFPVLRFRGVVGGVHDGFEEGEKRIGIGLSEILRNGEGATGVVRLDLFG